MKFNIYHIQDPDRPMWVISESYQDAIKQWKEFVAQENDTPVAEVDDPAGVHLVCQHDELLIPSILTTCPTCYHALPE